MSECRTIDERRATFRKLHESGCFVMPNPWDVGSARWLQHLGFPALATTSAGIAFSAGLPDTPTALSCDQVLAHVTELVRATQVPISVDFQAGYAAHPEGVAANVQRCVRLGACGISIEDATGDRAAPLYALEAATERVRAARSAIDAGAAEAVLTARAECFLVGHADPLRESIRRLQAYAQAGADVVFAPGLRRRDQIAQVVQAMAPTPVNVLMFTNTGLGLAELAALGVRRVSVGSALARVAWAAFMKAAKTISDRGSFEWLEGAAPFADLNALFDQEAPDTEG